MNLSFLRFLKRDKGRAENNVVVVPPPIVAIEKPASERLGRTFLPNIARSAEPEAEANFSVPETAGNGPAVITAPAIAPSALPALNAATIALPGAPPQEKIPSPPTKISPKTNFCLEISRPSESRPEKNERTIALPLADLSPHIPTGMLGPLQIDPERRILFKAAEIEQGMASGTPSVRLRSIYQQAPELFNREVSAEDTTQVMLPVADVLEQFTTFRVRSDQVRDPAVPQMDTPFLKVAMEDRGRFPTFAETVSPLENVAEPAVEPQQIPSPVALKGSSTPTTSPATTPDPPPVAEAKPIKPIRLSLPTQNKGVGSPSAASPSPSPLPEAGPPPPLIKPKFSPNGIGAPASERVPASSGPPVPTLLPSPFAPLPPTRISVKVTPSSDDLPAPVAPTPAPGPVVNSSHSPRIDLGEAPHLQLPLRAVLRGITPLQISGPTDEVPESAQLDIPFSIVEPQLSLGKVSLSPVQFVAALPAELRERFKIEDSQTPIPLPLEELLRNLPNDILRVRGDQESIEPVTIFETPFSQKAAEDAARFSASTPKVDLGSETPSLSDEESFERPMLANAQSRAADEVSARANETRPSPKPVVRLALEKTLLPGTSVVSKPSENAVPVLPPNERTPLQTILETDEALEPKSIVSHVGCLPGVRACAIMFSDGLRLADNLPAEYAVDALCAIAPIIAQRIGAQVPGANLGALKNITLFCAKESVSFFAHDNICLAALHAGADEMALETRTRLGAVAEELARLYRTKPNDIQQPNA